MAAPNHQRPSRHLEGFLFPKGESPMECKQHIRTILHQRTYMPGKKDRGTADGFLRFETNLRIIFHAVKHFSRAWGHKDFWVRVRPCLDFHHNTAEHNLDEIVHRYCAGRKAFHDAVNLGQRQPSPEAPGRIALLADFVISLSNTSPYEPSYREWEELESSWKSQLHGVLRSQGVLSSQVRDGTCAPELLPQKGAKTAAAASPVSRDTGTPKGRRGSVSRLESTLHKRRRSSDLSSRISFDKDHYSPTLEHSPITQYMPRLHGAANHANDNDKRAENQADGRGLGAGPTGIKERPHRVQSLDELVTDYSSGRQPPVFEAMGSAADSNTNTRKRSYPGDVNDDSISPKRLAMDTNISTGLDNISVGSGTSRRIQSLETSKQPQVGNGSLSTQSKGPAGDMQTKGAIPRSNSTGLDKPSVSKPASMPHTESISDKNKELAADTHHVNSKLAQPDVGKPKQLPTLAEKADKISGGLERRPQDLEIRDPRVDELQAVVGAMQNQLAQSWSQQERISNLELQLKDVRSELSLHSSKPDPTNTFESQLKDLRQQLTMRSSEQERIDGLQMQLQDLGKQLTAGLSERDQFANVESELRYLHSSDQERISSIESQLGDLGRQLAMHHADQQRVTRLESMVKELTTQSSQRLVEQQRFNSLELVVEELRDQLNERFSTQQISQHVDTQLRDIRHHVAQQATASANATEAQLGLFHEQLRNIQEQLSQRTAAPAISQPLSPHSLSSDSIVNADVKGFLNVLTSEMGKMRSSMKARIRDMDAAGEPDDDKKYAISDISYELGRVLELAKKRIQTL